MKKSRIVMNVMLAVNALVEFIFLPLVIFVLFATEQAIYVTAITLLSLAIIGTAVAASVMAGFDVKTRWFAAVQPSVIILFWCVLTGTSGSLADSLVAVAISFGLCAICAAAMLITSKIHRKKLAAPATTDEIIEENNETV